MRHHYIGCTLLLALAAVVLGQPAVPKIENANYTPAAKRNKPYVAVTVSKKLPVAGLSATLTGGSATVQSVEAFDISATDSLNFAVRIAGELGPEDSPQVCLTSGSLRPICAAITFKTPLEAGKERDAVLTEIRNTQKTSSEKNIFASGFVTTASTGTQGGADLALNSIDLGVPGLNSFVQIKKASQDGADHKNFEGGTRYRYIRSLNRELLKEIKDLPQGATMDHLIQQMQRRWVSAMMIDVVAKLEGQATKFDVSNFVGDTALHFRSMSKGLSSGHGYWRGFVMPVALEGGQSLRAGDTAVQNSGTTAGNALKGVDWIARYKAGAGTTLFYENWNSRAPIRRVDLDLSIVMRNLFFAEAMYNKKTKTIDHTGKGVRAYGQVDLRVYVGQSAAGRFGVRLSYNRGSLPPSFAQVKSFQFGFLFESAEDSKAR